MNSNLLLLRNFISLSATVFSSRLISSLATFFSFIFISRISGDGAAAGSLIAVVQIFIFTGATSLMYTFLLPYSKAYGMNDQNLFASTSENAILLVGCTTVVIILILLNITPILYLLKQPLNLLSIIQHYFNVLAVGVLPIMLVICLSQYFNATGRSRLIVKKIVFLFPLSIFLNYCFIFGKYGVPKLGIAGGAYGTSISYWILFILLAQDFFACSFVKKFIKLMRWPSFSKEFKEIVNIGIPIMLQNSADFIFMLALTILVGWLGKLSLEFQQVINQINMFLFLVPFAIAQVSSILISQCLGKNHLFQINRIANIAILLILVLSTVIGIFLILFQSKIVTLYLAYRQDFNKEDFKILESLFTIFAISQVLNALKTVGTGILRGLHKTKIPMVISIGGNWLVGLPISYYLGIKCNLNILGINIGYLIASSFSLILLCWYGGSIKKRIIKRIAFYSAVEGDI